MRILCGTDLLPKSASALERAGMLAERLGAKLSLVHAVPGADAEYLIEQDVERAESSLRALASAGRWRHGAAPSIEVRAGTPAQVLIETARELEPALIVLGSNRRRFPRDTLGGTLAERILKRIDCPVLIVRRMPWRDYRSVLMVLDCAESGEVVRVAGELVLHDPARTAVAHAHDPFCEGASTAPDASAPALVSGPVGLISQPLGVISQPVESDAPWPGHEYSRTTLVHERAMTLDPLRRDVRHARPDLLVVGAGRRGWLRRTLLGDVVSRVLEMRGSDVLVVPRRRACMAARRRRGNRSGPKWPFWLRRPDAATG